MKSTIFASRTARWVRNILGGSLLLGVALSVAFSQRIDFFNPKKSDKNKEDAPRAMVKLPVEPGAVEVAFTDGSNLKMILRDDKIALATSHGKLFIPVRDIQGIEFATRLSGEDAKRIGAAVADLGSSEFRQRETASTELLKLHEKAYPALQRAAEQKDIEVVRRARELLEQIAASVPEENLVIRKNDFVYTTESMISGRIEGASLKADTSQFGPVQVKLSDMRALRSQAMEPGQPYTAMIHGRLGRKRDTARMPTTMKWSQKAKK